MRKPWKSHNYTKIKNVTVDLCLMDEIWLVSPWSNGSWINSNSLIKVGQRTYWTKTENSLNEVVTNIHILTYIHLLIKLKSKFLERKLSLGGWGLVSNTKIKRRKRESFIDFSLMDFKMKLMMSSSRNNQEMLINLKNN